MPQRSRSTAVTGWPRAANQRVCRPPPHATSSTAPPDATAGPNRVIQVDGSTAKPYLGYKWHSVPFCR